MLGLGKRMAVLHGADEENGGAGQTGQEKKDECSCEPGRIGLIVGILAIVLIVGLYLTHDARITRIQTEFNDKLASLADTDARMGMLEKRLGAIEALPEMARKMYVDTAIADIKQRAAALADMAGKDQKAALAKVEEILGDLQNGPAK
ncbi:MAG: hypothetical protein HQK81_05505 [Desulfovibrionaceae bacterium]|nr:hypothetical protein [Desulfovibrionaceae bacterium]MBF0513504.1 hypothetical protein [Desulfovibrionaceae bacterium]